MQIIRDGTYELIYSKVNEKEIAAINHILERTEIIETIYQYGKQYTGNFCRWCVEQSLMHLAGCKSLPGKGLHPPVSSVPADELTRMEECSKRNTRPNATKISGHPDSVNQTAPATIKTERLDAMLFFEHSHTELIFTSSLR